MERYANLSGNSPIDSYEIGDDFIWVKFGKLKYKYTHVRPGIAKVDKMKLLAEKGIGLCRFITKHVGKRYVEKKRWDGTF